MGFSGKVKTRSPHVSLFCGTIGYFRREVDFVLSGGVLLDNENEF